MKSIQNQYRDLKEGRMSQANFMRNLRMTMPQYVTNVTSFNDSVRILKNKGILAEADIYGIAGDPEKEADARAMAIKRKKQDLEDDELDDLINKYDTEKQGEEDILSQWDPLEEGIDNETAQDIAMNATSFEDAVNRLWDEGVDMDIAREIAGQYHDEELYESKKGKSLHPNQIHPQELRMGIQVEMEHTDDPKKAEKIALDHLAENPFYYTQLKLSGVDTKALPTKEKKAIAKKKDETELVDKANQMKPVKGVEKVKASANKAHKETNKGVSGVQLMSLVAKSSRGVKKMDPTGEKSKKISVKESFLNEDHLTDKQDQIDYILKSGIYAGSREYLNKQTDERIQHLYDKVEKEVKGGNLGAAFNKFKEHLESLVREVLSEMKK
jgi:hypothetical protein